MFALAAVMLAAQKNACGQEAMRIATAADQAETAAEQQNEGVAQGYYNFLVGPTAWRFSSGLGLAYNDNIRCTQTPESDLIVSPSLFSQMHWPVTLNNSLDISLNVGYAEYLQHSQWSEFYINSGSGFSFDIYVGECKINLHDQIYIAQSGYQNPGVSVGNQSSQYLENTAGASATFNLGKLVPTIGYDHADYLSLVTSSNPNTISENFTGSLGLPVGEEFTVGAEAGGSLIDYEYSGQPANLYVTGATQWSAGLYGTAQISDYLSGSLHGGYTEYIPDNTVPGQPAGTDAGFYFSASLVHQLNQWVNYTLSAGRSTDLSSFGQIQTRTYAQISPSYTLLRNYSISTPLTYQVGSRPGYTPSGGGSDYSQLVVGINVSRPITRKLTASLGYQYVEEESALAGLAYTVDIISLNLTYQF